MIAFAIGDIHGQVDLAHALLQRIINLFNQTKPERRVLIGLGDYVDRGPESAEVLEILISIDRHPSIETHFLRGNHEQAMLDFLDDAASGPAWARFGGETTLASYGVPPPQSADPGAWATAREQLLSVIPPSHMEFLRGLPSSFSLGDYFFVHAGAAPGKALEDQSDRDLLWIREKFLNDQRPFSQIIVHGHSPNPEVHSDHRRIGIDTGAYATGLLTAVRLEGETRSLLQARRGPVGKVAVHEQAVPEQPAL